MTINVINVFDLMESRSLIRCQDCKCLTQPTLGSTVLMISHRWECPDTPDPDGIQYHGIIRFAIQSCMMAMGSTPNVFNCVDSSEVILCPDLYTRLLRSYNEFVGRAKVGSAVVDQRLANRVQQLAKYMLETVGPQNTVVVANDLLPLAFMMNQLYVWYDFTSLPQPPRSAVEQLYFSQELQNLDEYFSDHFTVIIRSQTALKRAWCFLEAAISSRAGRQSIFSSENSLLSSTERAPIEQLFHEPRRIKAGDHTLELRDMNHNLQKQIDHRDAVESGVLRHFERMKEPVDLSNDLTGPLAELLNQANHRLNGNTRAEVLSYLVENGFKCTNGSDIELIACKLAAHYT